MIPHSRPLIRLVLCLTFVMSLMTQVASAQTASDGRYIVVLRGNAGNPSAVATALSKRVHATLKVDRVFTHALNGFAGRFPPRLVALLLKDPNVLSIDVDQPVSAAAQTLPTGVDRIDADRSPTAAIDGVDTRVNVDVAVLDSGVGPHADLNVVGGKDCTGIGSYNDDNGHGTHVAGIIGALDNGSGVVGVAPGARIWSVKVLDRYGNGSWSNVICGIDWVTANAGTIAIANMSLGGSGVAGSSCASSSLRQAICNSVNAGVTYVVAAGNSARNVSSYVPAAFPEVMAISALADFNGRPGGGAAATCRADTDDGLAGYSNYGAGIALAAPGDCIYSTWLGNGFNTISGTSMAAPHVAGAAALYIAANGRVGPAAVRAGLVAGREQMHMAGDPDGIDEGIVHVGLPDQPPSATISAPSADAVVFGNVPIKIQASDPDDATPGLTVEYKIDAGAFAAAPYNATSGLFETTLDSTTLTDGAHTITARATDRDGAQGTSTPITVTVRNANQPPVANAGADQTLHDAGNDGTEAVLLDGSGSTDADGTIASYAWTEGATALATGAKPTVAFATGTHTVTLTVTDDRGATATDQAVITVTADQPPVASAGADQALGDPDGDGAATVTLDGSASSDPDGTIADYSWSENGTVLATVATPTLSLAVGTHAITLTVTDNDGATATDDVIVTINVNAAPTARAGADQTLRDNGGDGVEQVSLDGSASSDPDGTIASYAWTEDGVQLATGATPTLSLAVGTHTITLTVTDNGGASDANNVVITVTADQKPIARAGGDQTIHDAGGDGVESVVLDGSASSDPDGTIAGYRWSENGATLATGATATISLGVGTHTITLTVTDNDGLSDGNNVVVTVNANQAPTARAGADQSVGDPDGDGSATVALDGSASSDPDGTIASYRWTENGTTVATEATASVSLPVGVHTIRLTVTDNDGATDANNVVITVNPNQPPAADAGADRTVTDADGNGQEAVALAGGGNDDDGSIAAYRWFEGGTQLAQGLTPTVTLALGTHTITLTVTDNGGASASDTVTVVVRVGKPAAPTNLKVGLKSSGTVALTWTDNATNETGYRVYRSTDGGVTWVLIKDNLAPNTKAYTDSTRLVVGTTYSYYVVAVNSAGESTPSNVASLKR